MKQPKKWYDVYPYGTKEGEDESKVFLVLARDKDGDYRSISSLIKRTGLTRKRVEEIIDKYATQFDPPLIYPHPSNDDHWGYWERCPDRIPEKVKSISGMDKEFRIKRRQGS